jgi:ABC-2 type transport system ATP-binding protein
VIIILKDSDLFLENVDFYYGKKQILRQISISVSKGVICALLGPSGCGKTTLVKIAAGILRPKKGCATVLGQKMPQISAMSHIGYMAQSDALYLTLSAEENLSFFGSMYGMRRKELKKRMSEVLELVNLTADLKKPVHQFSGGMKRRLSLAMSLLHNPPVLILDEPTVGIDPVLRKDVWDNLYILAKEGATILVTTHVMDEAEKCEQIAMLRDGCLLAHGSIDDILSDTKSAGIEEAYLKYIRDLKRSI